MSNHSRRGTYEQDVICTAFGCKADVDERFYPSLICLKHALKVFRVLDETRRWAVQADVMAPTTVPERDQGLKKRLQDQAVVYYIQFGPGIKIGTTTNMKQRLNSFALPESAVLATEPGSYDLERSRHEFFADTRIPNTEIFTESPKIRKHIEAVKRYHGEPKITSYLPSR